MDNISGTLVATRTGINERLKDVEPLKLILISGGTVFLVSYLYSFLFDSRDTLSTRIKRTLFRYARMIPKVRQQIDKELEKAKTEVSKTLLKTVPGEKFHVILPEVGMSVKELESELKFVNKMGEIEFNKGRVTGCVYHDGEEANREYHELLKNTYGMFMWTNPLHPDVFPGVRKLESEIVRMGCTLFNGDAETCGFVSSGGTESILMAIKAYRNRAYERGITRPELIVPESAHAAFDKACEYFCVKIIHVSVDPQTRRADVRKMKKAITRNTIALVGSAPSFGHGVIDPIEELAAIAKSYDIGMHVDGCLGGFLTAFMKDAGFSIPPCDFSVSGVTSISADTHKYGYAPKGSSLLMWRNKKWRSYQFFTCSDWPGGIYVSPAIAGSRSGAIIAATWAAMMYHGKKGYVERTRRIVETTRYIEAELRKIPHVFIYGSADTSVVALGSNDFDILRLTTAMAERGWQLSNLQFPSSIHLCVTLMHTKPGIKEEFVKDIRECVEILAKTPEAKPTGSAALYGTAQKIPDRTIIHEVGKMLLDVIYTASADENKKV